MSATRGIARQLSAALTARSPTCGCMVAPLSQSLIQRRGLHSTAPALVKFTDKDVKEMSRLFKSLGFEGHEPPGFKDDMFDPKKFTKVEKAESELGTDMTTPMTDKDGNLTPLGEFVTRKYQEWEQTPEGRRLVQQLEGAFKAEMMGEFGELDAQGEYYATGLTDNDDMSDDEDDDDDEEMGVPAKKKKKKNKDREETLDDLENDEEGDEEEETLEDLLPEGMSLSIFEIRRVVNQTGGGKVESYAGLVAVGNRNGVCGYGRGKSFNPDKAVMVAVKKALRRLQYIPRFNDHTINHDLYVKFRQTRLYMRPRPHGHGLVAHNIISDLCMLSGIRDISANIVGNTHKLNMVRAYFEAVQQQRTLEEICQARGKNVVTLRRSVKVAG